jgi:hypothetical protein
MLNHCSQCRRPGRAVAETPAVGRILRLRLPRGKGPHRQIQRELHPILRQVHSLFIALRELVPVVTLQHRTHGQEIFNRNLALAWIKVLCRALVQHAQNRRLGSG